jgi:hypothetical protein
MLFQKNKNTQKTRKSWVGFAGEYNGRSQGSKGSEDNT